MGNCAVVRLCGCGGGGGGEQVVEQMIKVVTATGGVMELYPPITVECITNEFPGHSIFLADRRLLQNESLLVGNLYHLSPTNPPAASFPAAASAPTPYRMSDVYPRSGVGGSTSSSSVWKVRLVINPEQLSEILSHQARTEELLDTVRTVAKCRGSARFVGLVTN